jgi:hypothetical protein
VEARCGVVRVYHEVNPRVKDAHHGVVEVHQRFLELMLSKFKTLMSTFMLNLLPH